MIWRRFLRVGPLQGDLRCGISGFIETYLND